MSSTYCPDCDGRINLSTAKAGQKLTCPHCDTQLEVISVDPLELDWVYDWSEEEELEEGEEEEEW